MSSRNQPLSQARQVMKLYPQAKVNLRVARKIQFTELTGFNDELHLIEQSIPGKGRVLVRYSGTEPKIRLLAECATEEAATTTISRLRELVGRHLVIV